MYTDIITTMSRKEKISLNAENTWKNFIHVFEDLLGEHFSLHGEESFTLSFDDFNKRFRRFLLLRYSEVDIRYLYIAHEFRTVHISAADLTADIILYEKEGKKIFAPPIPCFYFGGALANNIQLKDAINNEFCHSVIKRKYKYMLTVDDIYHSTSWRDGGLKIKFTIHRCE